MTNRTLKTFAGITLAVASSVSLASTASAATSPNASSTLAKIRFCESGGNYAAQNTSSTASGAYQFLDTTWYGLEGTTYAHAKDAPAALQDAAALKLFSQAGTSPWLASQGCWGSMSSTPSYSLTNTISSTAKATTTTASQAHTNAVKTVKAKTTPIVNQVAAKAITTVVKTNQSTDKAVTANGLTASENSFISRITQLQKQQSWWTVQASQGQTVARTIVATSGTKIQLQSAPSFTSVKSSDASLKSGTSVTGQYVNTDWFKITSGKNAGKFISTDFLTRLAPSANGKMSSNQLVQLPSEFQVLGGNQQVSFVTAKSMVQMNAAYRAKFGQNLMVKEGYRSFQAQQALGKSLGAGNVDPAGQSQHGYGQAVDLGNIQLSNPKSANVAWLKGNEAKYGFASQSSQDANVENNYHYAMIG